jgi:hypothetical protein
MGMSKDAFRAIVRKLGHAAAPVKRRGRIFRRNRRNRSR